MKSGIFGPLAGGSHPGAAEWMRQFQDWLCHRLEIADGSGSKFQHNAWSHAGGGGGVASTFAQGTVLEKGSVIFSEVWDQLNAPLAQQLQLQGRRYFATSVAAGLHPRSPMVPSSHLSLRYFEIDTGEAWFAGSLDLTPVYVDVAQARWFHAQLQATCNRHDAAYYPRFKAAADEHFYLPHRGETRGVGGLHFDRLLVGRDGLFEELLAFVQDVGEVYGRTYCTLMGLNAHLPYSEPEKYWQQVRRARFAEFSLTAGGPGRLEPATGYPEGIVLSLPPHAEWHYRYAPLPGSPEAQTQQWLRRGVDWLAPQAEAVVA